MTTLVQHDLVDRVLDRIDERELVELALRLGNIESPRGEEGAVGEAIFEWCRDAGLRTQRLGMFEDRFNVLAEVESRGTGPSVALNAHMDTSARRDDIFTVRDPGQPVLHTAWEDGDYLVGNPVVNDKGPLAATMIAAKALLESGVKLGAPVYLHLVPGEIGQEPIDEFQGKRYLSKEVGIRYLLQHAPRPAFCVNAEATGLRKGWIEAGKAHMRVTIFGAGSKYTPYLERPYTPENPPTALLQTARAIEAIEKWAEDYEKRNTYVSAGGTIVPKVSIGAVRSGDPSYILQSPELCVLYLDIRTNPLQTGADVATELRDLLEGIGIECDVRQTLNRRSYEAQGIEPLVDALDQCHLAEFGFPCEMAEPPVTSMWRDHLIYIEMGIPGLTYGPRGEQGVSSGGQGALQVSKRDLVGCARVYATTALAVCGVEA